MNNQPRYPAPYSIYFLHSIHKRRYCKEQLRYRSAQHQQITAYMQSNFAGKLDMVKLQYQQEWITHPIWKDLKGVKTEKYFKFDLITWNLGGGALAAKLILDDLYTHFGIQ
ncbi:hypothetical protein [Paenibacillus periandrae]|uniref:hypothetical protein n=1 Tax=Paenibacillus periandrae TaxID=1761741 RepID=UPI001F089044|nr:hypothetical protein [Paenibacillus periandrae]